MSWYSLSVSGKQVWDSHSYYTSLITGGFIGKIVMDKGVKKIPAYETAREKVSCYLAGQLYEKCSPYNKTVATTLLEGTFNQETAAIARAAIKKRLLNVSKDDFTWALKHSGKILKTVTKNATIGTIKYLKNPQIYKDFLRGIIKAPRGQLILSEDSTIDLENHPKKMTSEEVNSLVAYIFSNYSKEDAQLLVNLLKELKFTEFGYKAFILYLQPLSEKVVKSAITSGAKTGIGMGIDIGVKKVITVATVPILYSLAKSALEVALDQLPKNPWTETISQGTDYLPSVSTVLWGSAAVHIGVIGYLFWKTLRYTSNKSGSDKAAIRELVLGMTKNSLIRKMDEYPLFKTVGIEMDQPTKDKLATQLIDQAIDLHWPKLTRTKWIGIPLAT